MQPYLFPYLGYFQLIKAVDMFVIYDDVQYIKRGWINRNHIFSQNGKQRITLQVLGGSLNSLINQVKVGSNGEKLLKTLQHNYSKSPYFKDIFPLLERILLQKEKNLVHFLDYALKQTCEYLNVHPKWYFSSSLTKDNTLQGQDKILSICKTLGVNEYINLPGGRGLYNHEKFHQKDLRLSFIQPRAVEYQQFNTSFIPNLSIIDVMMFNSQKQCGRFLKEYDVN
ncbi:WbqC family protein [Desulfobulbus oligotrophicus]|uniref:WbqC family protein n=2 Tax=Desulfobulbus oligotrophicus TaxID=1909699 RepID=A0A7T5VG58_9BACT|nr:WbqC family protein [Desulfobulbus oligotrophicus]